MPFGYIKFISNNYKNKIVMILNISVIINQSIDLTIINEIYTWKPKIDKI